MCIVICVRATISEGADRCYDCLLAVDLRFSRSYVVLLWIYGLVRGGQIFGRFFLLRILLTVLEGT